MANVLSWTKRLMIRGGQRSTQRESGGMAHTDSGKSEPVGFELDCEFEDEEDEGAEFLDDETRPTHHEGYRKLCGSVTETDPDRHG